MPPMKPELPEQPSNTDNLDAEIEAALGDASLFDLAAEVPSRQNRGQARPLKSGIIAAIHGREVMVEFGPREQGVCPLDHFDSPPDIGASVDFVIERRDADGMLVLSAKGAVQKAKWDALGEGQVVEARCTGTNKGGLDMEVAGHAAFMPAGQVDLHHVPDLSIFVGEKFPCEVIELDQSRNRLVLSRRSVLAAERERNQGELLESLELGATVSATITSIKPYGAFADIGGLEGLIHVSEMSWKRLDNPEALLSVGDAVKVKVVDIDHNHEPPKLALSMKQLLEDPFAGAIEKIEPGATLSGRVTKLMDFGAFVELPGEVEGLVHISELADRRVNSPGQVVRVGEVVTVRVLSVDTARHRIALSMKQSGGGDEAAAREDDPAMRKLREKFGDGPLKGGLG
jgi:small subunit ribosomal protein S1